MAVLALAAFPAPGPARPTEAVPNFRHVIVVVFENKERNAVAGSSQAPTFARLAHRYASLTHYSAVAHPSLPNYLALVSGSTQSIASDCTSCVVDARSLADTLTQAGRTWRTYAEGLPSPGYTGASAGLYAKKHDPFLYFRDVADAPARRANVVAFSQFRPDMQRRRLPSFALVVPNLCNDMHSCSVATGDSWLRREIVPLLDNRALSMSVVFVLFDEGTSDSGGGGNVDALALGPLVRPGVILAAPMNHYNVLRTIESAWQLPLLGNSRTALPITGIWRTPA